MTKGPFEPFAISFTSKPQPILSTMDTAEDWLKRDVRPCVLLGVEAGQLSVLLSNQAAGCFTEQIQAALSCLPEQAVAQLVHQVGTECKRANVLVPVDIHNQHQLLGMQVQAMSGSEHQEKQFLAQIMVLDQNSSYLDRQQIFLDALPMFVAVVDHTCRIQFANRALCQVFQSSDGELRGQLATDLFHEWYPAIQEALQKEMNGEPQQFPPFKVDHKTYTATCHPLAPPLNGLLLCWQESAQLGLSRKNGHGADSYDPLTQLPDRKFAKDYLERLIGQKQSEKSEDPIFVLLIDMDNFKVLNDIHGHEFGDKILAKVARRITHVTKDSDLVARLGGDEFLMVVNNASLKNVEKIEQRLLKKLMEPYTVEGKTYTTTVSIGVSVYPKDGQSANKLLRKADTAMYHAKGGGRNRSVHFRNIMEDDLRSHSKLMGELHEAVKNFDFYMVYQPVWDPVAGKVVAAEALIRWENPVLGQVPPGMFIPVAEKSWLIDAIGQWTLEHALKDLKKIQAVLNDTSFAMNINISAFQLRDASLRHKLVDLCNELQLNKGSIELEITERMLIGDVDHAGFELKELSKLGLVLAIDDFGTGYSSFGLLRDIPFKTVKIDQSFVQDLPEKTTLIDTMVEMAKLLGLKIVAEGVETEAQLRHLTNKGCDYIQGFYVAKPMPVESLLDFIKREEFERS